MKSIIDRIQPTKNTVPIFKSDRFRDTKDPCPVFDGENWHIYGSGGSVLEEIWQVLHATAPSLDGPWLEEDPAVLIGLNGPHVAAPGVLFDQKDKLFHMFIQKDFLSLGGTVEYLTSPDGKIFTCQNTPLSPLPASGEAGLYDPHPAEYGGVKYLVYSGTPEVRHLGSRFVSKPDLYIATSLSGEWAGPWQRQGKILDHQDIDWHHNRREDEESYEWGMEGAQIIELPNRHVLLNATCFLPRGDFGTRQRVFFAIAESVVGPYYSIGPIMQVLPGGASGENGHATLYSHEGRLYLFYQARSFGGDSSSLGPTWQYGLAAFDAANLERVLVEYLKSDKSSYNYQLYR